MKFPLACAVLAVLACCATAARGQEAPLTAGGGSGNIRLFFGGKFLDKGDWTGTSSQPQVGLALDYAPEGWAAGLALDLLYSAVEGSAEIQVLGELLKVRVDIAASTYEVDVGARKYWTLLPDLRTYAAGGGALIHATWKPQLVGWRLVSTDEGFGYWLCGGLSWSMSRHATLGVELRWSSASVTIARQRIDAGGFHAGVLAGGRW